MTGRPFSLSKMILPGVGRSDRSSPIMYMRCDWLWRMILALKLRVSIFGSAPDGEGDGAAAPPSAKAWSETKSKAKGVLTSAPDFALIQDDDFEKNGSISASFQFIARTKTCRASGARGAWRSRHNLPGLESRK